MRSPFALIALVTCAVALGAAGSASAADCPGADLPPVAENVPQMSAATLCLINAERTTRGLQALTQQPKLDAASLAHSQDMVRNHYFAHDTLAGIGFVQRIVAAGYARSENDGWALGENLAWGSNERATPAQVVNALMHSTGHRENILDHGYREIGIGIVIGSPTGVATAATYTTDFGAMTAAAAPAKKKAKLRCVWRTKKYTSRSGKKLKRRVKTCTRRAAR